MIPVIKLVRTVAAAAPTNPPVIDSAAITSVWDFAVKGGVLMIPIGICSIIALALGVERLLSLRRSRITPPGFIEGLPVAVKDATADQSPALEYCRNRPSPIARICEAGLKRWDRTTEAIEKAIVEQGQREVATMRKHLRALAVIAAVCPLLGLLGTTFGMIRAFQTVATAPEALGRTEMLAGGIYEAMITTAAGLIVAIPTLILYHFLSSKIDRLVFEMDTACVGLIEQRDGIAPPAAPKPVVPAPQEEPAPTGVGVAAA